MKKQKPLGIDAAIDLIEAALFDPSEPGCADDMHGEVHINSIGRVWLRSILKRLRTGYIKHECIESLHPFDVQAREEAKARKKLHKK
jgi:hypothetical protein